MPPTLRKRSNRPQPSAPGLYGSACGKICKRGRSWIFHKSNCVATLAVRVIKMCFVPRRKPFCAAGVILLQCFQMMSYMFRAQRAALNVSIFILHGNCTTSDVVCVATFLLTTLSRPREMVKRSKCLGTHSICECDEKLTESSYKYKKTVLR